MRRSILIIVILLGLPAAVAWSLRDNWTAPEGFSRRTITYDGLERSYYLRLPPGYDKEKSYPLILLIHGGAGGAPQALRAYPLAEVTDREGAILVAPNGTGPLQKEIGRTWNVEFGFGPARTNQVDDTGFLRALILHLEDTLAVDRERVYLTGLSNGGILCHWMAARHSDLIRGIAPVAATLGGRDPAEKEMHIPPAPQHPVDVIMFCGGLDQALPPSGGAQLRHAEREPKVVLSALESAEFWAHHNGCSPTPLVEDLPEQQATRTTWTGGRDRTEVVLYVLHNQGHAWPGGNSPHRRAADAPSPLLKAHEVMWDFLERPARPVSNPQATNRAPKSSSDVSR